MNALKTQPRRATSFAATLILLLCAEQARAGEAPKAGDSAPDYAGEAYKGQDVSLAAYRGKVVLVDFWAPWCGPCLKELPLLDTLQKMVGNDRLQVISINIQPYDDFKKIARKMNAPHMLVACDDDYKQAQDAYGVDALPYMVIVGKDGRILKISKGYTDENFDRAIEAVNAALAQ